MTARLVWDLAGVEGTVVLNPHAEVYNNWTTFCLYPFCSDALHPPLKWAVGCFLIDLGMGSGWA